MSSYFERLSSRPDKYAAYALRSQAQIDALAEAASSSTARQPIVYDPAVDAARFTIDAKVSFDVKGRFLPLSLKTGTMFVVYDFKLHENFRYKETGQYIQKHKAWRFNPGPIWLALKTHYQHAANVVPPRFCELVVTAPSSKYVTGETWRGGKTLPDGTKDPRSHWYGEGLAPRAGEFFAEPNVWVRVFIFVEGLDQPTCRISVWAADEARGPSPILDQIEYLPLPQDNPLRNFQIEFDTSGDVADAGVETNPVTWGWTRDYVMLHNVSRAEVPSLLERPGTEGPVDVLPGIPGPIIVRRV